MSHPGSWGLVKPDPSFLDMTLPSRPKLIGSGTPEKTKLLESGR